MKDNLKVEDYYNTLFEKDSLVCYKNRIFKNGDDNPYFAEFTKDREFGFHRMHEYVCINELDIDSDGRAKDSNVINYKNLLFENDKISTEEQRKLMQESGLPYTTAVFSGNESIHYIISIENGIPTYEDYKMYHAAICAALLKYNYIADTSCSNPARLTRAPLALNVKHKQLQVLEEVNTPCSLSAIQMWLKSNGINLEDFKPKYVELETIDGPDSASNEERWELALKSMGDKKYVEGTQGDGEREPFRFQLTLKCKERGLSLEETIERICRQFKSTKGERNVRDGIVRAWKREVTRRPVMSKEDWIELKREQERLTYQAGHEAILGLENAFELDENEPEVIDRDYDRDLNRYFMVSNDIYMLVNRKIEKITTPRFRVFHRTTDLQLINRYVNFTVEPGYINFRPVINQYYNKFKIPQYKARYGNCDTVKGYLRHLAGTQYEMLLDYLQLSLFDPKQPLPVLLLISYDKNTGKSTFFELLSTMFGENVVPVSPNQFELEWNTQWIQKHFIFVDEAEKIKNNDAVSSKIKRLAYANTAELNKKGDDTEFVPFFGKFIFASNQASGFLDVDEKDDRYWILKVPKYASDFDPDFIKKLKNEVPAFAHFLMNRKLSTTNEGRGWFNPKLLRNSALEELIDINKPQIEIHIRELFEDWFDNRSDLECNFIISQFKDKLSEKGRYQEKDIKSALHKMWNITSTRDTLMDSFNGNVKRQKNAWYSVKREWFMTLSDFNKELENAYEL